jgi:UDP-N-acetylmuramate--alanine ligase
VGAAGAGMRALADVLVQQGWQLSGSDLLIDPVRHLVAKGVQLHQGHDAGHLPPDAELLVHSDAVPMDNPELHRAKELGIPTYSYFQMVGRLVSGKHTLAVAGTHGKSTTTAMAAEILLCAGADPTVFCGATLPGRSSGGRAGSGNLALVEACEYRANFLHLRPRHGLILNVEPDHFDCYRRTEDLQQAFARFARLLPADGLLLVGHDCRVARQIAARVNCRVETFAAAAPADWSARRLSARRGRFSFEIHHCGRQLCQLGLRIPGRHNVLNALAAAALAWYNGATAEAIARTLSGFRGLSRRLESVGTCRGVTLLDDYAHHPTEVSAALATARQMFPGKRLWCVFQPHQVSRTERLLNELAGSLQNADTVLVADIFRAREGPPQAGEVTAADLARRVREFSAEAPGGLPAPDIPPTVHAIEEIIQFLQTRLAAGDVLVTMGAGDIRRVCDGLIDRVREDRSAG